MRRIAFACVALVSTGCAGILGLDEFTEGEGSGPGAGGGTPTSTSTGDSTTSTGEPSTSTGEGGGGGSGDGGAGGGLPDPLDVTPEGNIKVGVFRSLQFASNVPTTWSVDEPDGGTIDENGLYIAPDEPGTFHVTATSVGNPEDSVSITITAAPLGVRLMGGIAGGPGTIDGPVSLARLNTPGGLGMVSNGDRMVVADTNSHTIRLWNRQQDAVSTIAGAPFQPGYVDGPGADARFNEPTRVVGEQASSTAYVVDHGNHCIRRVNTLTGVVSTLAGRCGTRGATDAATGGDVTFDDITSMVMGPALTHLYVCQEGGNSPVVRKVNLATGATATLPVATVSVGFGCRLATDFWRGVVYFTSYASSSIFALSDPSSGNPVVNSVVDRPQGASIDDLATMTGFGNSDDIYLSSQAALYHYRFGQPAFDPEPMIGPEREYVDGALPAAKMTSARVMLAYPQQGDLYFADGQGRTVRRFDVSQANVDTAVGVPTNLVPIDGPKAVARMPFPFTVALDEEGNIFTSSLGDGENDAQVIRRVDAVTGAISTFSGSPGGFQGQIVDGPADVATYSVVFDSVRLGDALYVLDFATHGVRRVELSDGSVTTIAGRPGEPGFSDGIGAQAQFDFEGAGGITTDGTFLYVADGGNHAIRRLDPATGEVTTLAGGTPGTSNGVGPAAQFLAPWGIAHDRGLLYVSDAEDQVVRRLDLDTLEVTSLIGLSGVMGSTDGDASVATFANPVRLAADGIGNLYVTSFPEEDSAEFLGAVIRRIDLDELTVSTFAGDRGRLGFAPGPLPSSLGCPLGIVVDGAGDLFFSDRCDGVIGAIRPL